MKMAIVALTHSIEAALFDEADVGGVAFIWRDLSPITVEVDVDIVRDVSFTVVSSSGNQRGCEHQVWDKMRCWIVSPSK